MANYDYEKIPRWNSQNPAFEILSDEMNGRIPVVRLEHWKDFDDLIESDFFNPKDTQLVFRGHRRSDWALMPSLARVTQNGIIDEPLADSQLNYFKLAVRGRLIDHTLARDDSGEELWSIGQHHGLMTPLLDWTYSPYVAMFFAFEKEDSSEEDENHYRSIYVLNKTFVNEGHCPEIKIVEPIQDDHGRLVNQAGLFTFSPFGNTIENELVETIGGNEFEDDELRSAAENEQAPIIAKYICKILIKNEDRENCMRHLRRMNVHHASLFPDLIGASEYSNLIIAEERRNYEIKQLAKRANIKTEVVFIPETARPVYISDQKNAPIIAVSLDSKGDSGLDHGEIQLLAENIDKEINKLKSVDWQLRENIQSKMKNKIRILMRKAGFPSDKRDQSIENILDFLKNQEKES